MLQETIYDNRELSWLKFNKRVLEEAVDENNPLCERLSFVSIFQSNLDEFLMVRVGSLDAGKDSKVRENKTNLTCQEQLDRIIVKEKKLREKKDEIYLRLMYEMEEYGVKELLYKDLNEDEQDSMKLYFENEIQPFISPQVVGKRQPFPFLRNKEIYAVVELRTKSNNTKIGIIPCNNPVIKRMIPVSSDGRRFMLAEELFLEHSRIYIFGKDDPKVYIASADFMTRNTVHRVEVAAPVYDPVIKARILDDFELFYQDDQKAREQINGIYLPKHGDKHINAQETQYAQAYKSNETHA